MMRVWSEELFGTQFAKRYHFGEQGEKLYIGSLFTGKEKQVAAFQSAGNTVGQVELKVTGGRICGSFQPLELWMNCR